MKQLIHILAWLRVFISPFLIGLIAGVIVYYNYQNIYGVFIAVLLIILGIVSGVLMAENIRKEVGLLFFSSTPFKKEKKPNE